MSVDLKADDHMDTNAVSREAFVQFLAGLTIYCMAYTSSFFVFFVFYYKKFLTLNPTPNSELPQGGFIAPTFEYQLSTVNTAAPSFLHSPVWDQP